MAAVAEESDDYCNNVEPIYATVVDDVDDAVEHIFQFLAVADKPAGFGHLAHVFCE